MSNRSEEINNLVQALAKAQGAYKPLVANDISGALKFANLEAILDSVREALSSNGLAFYQYIELMDEGSGASLLKTTISHESGQWISTNARVVGGSTFKETFNSIEAYRRLHALLILGIAPSKGDPLIKDDDGMEQYDKKVVQEIRKPKEVSVKTEFADKLTNDQYTDLMYELEGYDEITAQMQQYYDITTLADLPKTEYHTALARIRRIKNNIERTR